MAQFPSRRPPVVRPNAGRATVPSKRPPLLWLAVGLLLVVIISLVLFLGRRDAAESPASQKSAASEPTFDKTQFSLDDPTSPWLVVNKQRPLDPKTYTPELVAPNIALRGAATSEAMQVSPGAAAALEKLDAAAQAANIGLVLLSGYRSYDSQAAIYASEVKGFGQTVADQESARPGHSEHQTGWAADLGAANKKCDIEVCFADTPEGTWLAANAHTFGFVIRYAKNKTDVTGYMYEPWHLRYVGTELAAEMHRTGTPTLEEFFDLPAAAAY